MRPEEIRRHVPVNVNEIPAQSYMYMSSGIPLAHVTRLLKMLVDVVVRAVEIIFSRLSRRSSRQQLDGVFSLCIDEELVHITLAPFDQEPLKCWTTLGACHLRFNTRGVGLTKHELSRIEKMRPAFKEGKRRHCRTNDQAKSAPAHSQASTCKHDVKPSDSWPFSGDAEVDQLLRAAERVASQFLQQLHSGVSGRCCAAYHYGFRDTVSTLGVLSEAHADNVGASDAFRDFAPVLHRMIQEWDVTASNTTRGPLARNRDEALCAMVQGTHSAERGFNIWILLDDDADGAANFPLVFADLSAHYDLLPQARDAPTTADPGPDGVYECVTAGLAGTRHLKGHAHSHATYRAQPAMVPGDAYIFETWGPHAAYHAGATRVPCPPTARRRSVEVRLAVVVPES